MATSITAPIAPMMMEPKTTAFRSMGLSGSVSYTHLDVYKRQVTGLANGTTLENFTTVVQATGKPGMALFTAVVATSFAYEGWIIATSINGEIKDAKKNLPRALVLGTFIVMAVYVLYYIGLAGSVPNAVIMESGEQGARIAFENIFGRLGGTALFVFVVISCLGTLNGLMLGCSRGMYLSLIHI